VSGSGVVVMTDPADSLAVEGTAIFGGGDESGDLTAGALGVLGDFIQPPGVSASSFATSGTFKTGFFGSTASQRISFAYPGSSHFQSLDVTGAAAGITLLTDVPVQGQLVDTATAVPFGMTGNGHSLTVGGVNVTHEIFDHVLFGITGSAITAFDNVTFQDYATSDTQLSVATTGTFTFSGLTFSTTPTTGLYVRANGAGLNLTIQSNLTPAAAAALTQLLNGALVNWQ
jgi:hypothetical protein